MATLKTEAVMKCLSPHLIFLTVTALYLLFPVTLVTAF